MPEKNGVVSVIIPAYNAGPYIQETIGSILSQSYNLFEIIVINDGSIDQTPNVVSSFTDNRLLLINQSNTGVSAARNTGLSYANGEFIVFFDADDIMSPDFLHERVDALLLDKEMGFVGGWVESFPGNHLIRKAVAVDPERQILFFDSEAVTVPSNYMFRKRILLENCIEFNPALSSTADRFFLLQVSKRSKGICLDNEKGKLLYRVSPSSMSHRVTGALMLDNVTFYNQLKEKSLLPARRKRQFSGKFFFGLAAGYFKIKDYRKSLFFFSKSFVSSPVQFFFFFFNRLFKLK